ncbi:hypothetical protein LGT39_04860 [Demequina sp. TTPB684]|uniref:hypothetical protein n=1 Tax=unclassified Demequina TaxID=2620311 RepID=UPI001CF47604|nr:MULTISPECIES: hypothetical protein [unclassified Demequina]MCB2412180.1 hypothetical protein [Demequina sp. TTPB684]UPU88395.1 hypothetical protein LGT36_000260 [Demequina sp. TMPB413]
MRAQQRRGRSRTERVWIGATLTGLTAGVSTYFLYSARALGGWTAVGAEERALPMLEPALAVLVIALAGLVGRERLWLGFACAPIAGFLVTGCVLGASSGLDSGVVLGVAAAAFVGIYSGSLPLTTAVSVCCAVVISSLERDAKLRDALGEETGTTVGDHS